LLVAKRYDFPRAALSKLGGVGLDQRGLINDKLAGVMREVQQELPAFWEQIRETAETIRESPSD
jgi:hypothetical protein